MKLHIGLLGDFRIVQGESPFEGALSPRAQSLLAYLVLHRQASQPRSQVAFAFWRMPRRPLHT